MIKFILDLIKRVFSKSTFTGVNLDLRTDEEKSRDFLHEELASSSRPIYGSKADAELMSQKYLKEDQKHTFSCVAHGDTLALGIDSETAGRGFQRLSKAFYYRHRINYPGEGMNGDDAGKIAKNIGSCDYVTLPSPITEKDMNSVKIDNIMRAEALHHRAKNFVTIKQNYNDIDTLASIASQGKAIPIFIFSTTNEFGRTYPLILDKVFLETAPLRHCVCVLPNASFIENGVKYITIQDSVPFGGTRIRYLSQEFVRQRVYYAKYFTELVYDPLSEKPIHTFTKKMKVGDDDDEVEWLQKCLQYLKLFPSNTATGFYGGITKKSVSDFQVMFKDEILTPAGLQGPTGIVGEYTLAKLNNLFSKK